MEIPQVSWRDFIAAVLPLLLITLLAVWAGFKFIRPAPPNTIIITGGAKGSSFANAAEKYRAILERNGVKLQILESEGSLDNLRRLRDPAFKVDVGFVQGGLVVDGDAGDLVSLGSLFYVPLVVFYRGEQPIERLSEFKGKRLAIGREGSGTHFLNVLLLRANGVDKTTSTLLDLSGADAAQALLERKIDAALLMGDAATPEIMRKLVHTRGIHMMDFNGRPMRTAGVFAISLARAADGLDRFCEEHAGADDGVDRADGRVVARPDLHPALSDLLVEAARETHGRATCCSGRANFPALLEHEYPISGDAARYYKSGKGFGDPLSAVLAREPGRPHDGRAGPHRGGADPGH